MILLSITTILCFGLTIYFSYRAFVLAGLLTDQEEYYEQVRQTNEFMYMRITQSYEQMQNIDRIGAFEEDDESGTTFALLKQVIDDLKEEFDAEEKKEK
tara:strand:+ start:41 stop:337 length:297 start_codon:yes stop_codon:yes gene_type:complete